LDGVTALEVPGVRRGGAGPATAGVAAGREADATIFLVSGRFADTDLLVAGLRTSPLDAMDGEPGGSVPRALASLVETRFGGITHLLAPCAL